MSEADEANGKRGKGQTYVMFRRRGKTVCVRARVGLVETSALAVAEVYW
jgi:hypothetical protein